MESSWKNCDLVPENWDLDPETFDGQSVLCSVFYVRVLLLLVFYIQEIPCTVFYVQSFRLQSLYVPSHHRQNGEKKKWAQHLARFETTTWRVLLRRRVLYYCAITTTTVAPISLKEVKRPNSSEPLTNLNKLNSLTHLKHFLEARRRKEKILLGIYASKNPAAPVLLKVYKLVFIILWIQVVLK